jgi:hypothetical protein
MMTFAELRREIELIARSVQEDQVLPTVAHLLQLRYDDFDDEARAEADRILTRAIEIGAANARARIARLEDGPEKRSMARVLARTDGAHVTAYDLMAVLERKTQQTAPVVAAAVPVFACALQVCADLLFDARIPGVASRRDIVLHGLFMGLVDELMTAFHLAQRAFAGQAYAHLRTVEEVLDAMDVLVSDAGLLDRWLDATAPDAERAVFKVIRQRVGSEVSTADSKKLYAFLSALGPHFQSRSLQARMEVENVGDASTATISFVGSPHQLEAANVLTVRAAVATAHQVARVFATVLQKDDVTAQLASCQSKLVEFMCTHLLPVASQMRLTVEEIELVLSHRISHVPS